MTDDKYWRFFDSEYLPAQDLYNVKFKQRVALSVWSSRDWPSLPPVLPPPGHKDIPKFLEDWSQWRTDNART